MILTETRLRHFTRVTDLDRDDLADVLDLASACKSDARPDDVLRGQTVACMFEHPSTRTHLSFAAAIARLGATPILVGRDKVQLGRGETIADTARSLSGYCAAIVTEGYPQEAVDELAQWASVPVINAVSDEQHPCQVLAETRFGGNRIVDMLVGDPLPRIC